MKFSILASGSSGNSLFLETEKQRILVDVGLSGKQLEQRLRLINIDPSTISAILISHEHIDHVKGLGVFCRRYQIPVYLNLPTFQALPKQIGEIPEQLIHFVETGRSFELADLWIDSFPVSHDAAEPMAFTFTHQREKLAIVTDLGYVNQKIIDRVADADTFIWESNHDIEMLRMGTYPWNVKRRILSDVGHLSNQDAGEALAHFLRGEGQQVFLAHLSKDNNLSELAHLTIKNILEEAGFAVGRDVQLLQTYDDRPTSVREVNRKVLK
jgi:phosphoribosyl 1,2-cyclic phosphodiesterase